MRRSRFTEEQIIAAIKEHEVPPGGTGELCRRLGVSTETLYRWRRKYGGMEVSEARRLRGLEEENSRRCRRRQRLKRLVADQALDLLALRDLLSKNF